MKFAWKGNLGRLQSNWLWPESRDTENRSNATTNGGSNAKQTWKIKIRQAEAEAMRRDQERQRKFEQAKINRLVRDASARRRAHDIRAYVADVRATLATRVEPISHDEVAIWTSWALAEADRIDPIISGKFLERIPPPED